MPHEVRDVCQTLAFFMTSTPFFQAYTFICSYQVCFSLLDYFSLQSFLEVGTDPKGLFYLFFTFYLYCILKI